MRNDEGPGRVAGRWRIFAGTSGRGIELVPVPNDQLLRRSDSGDGPDCWESVGGRPRFQFDFGKAGSSLAPGWYELRGYLHAREGKVLLPSLHPHYVEGSALTSAELTLPGPDRSGRVVALLMFYDDVDSLAFYPSITPVRFQMHGFELRRISRIRALRHMLGGPCPDPRGPGRAGRAWAWARGAMRVGRKRATDDLYADYRRRLRPPGLGDYEIWTRKYDTIGPIERAEFKTRAEVLEGRGAAVSILLPLRDASEQALRRCLDGVLDQARGDWELCVVDDASSAPHVAAVLSEYAQRDARVRVKHHGLSGGGAEAFNVALTMARHDYVLPLDHGVELRPHAVLCVAEALLAYPETSLVYSDQDRCDGDGHRLDPRFKPDWNPDLLRSQDYVGHIVVIRTRLAREVGGFRPGFEPCHRYDLLLRCTERLAPDQIRHVPEILCHLHAAAGSGEKGRDADMAGARAVADQLSRMGTGAMMVPGDRPPGLHRVRWPVPEPAPKVSLIIPTRDRADLLEMCVESILAKSSYPDFELIVVDNQSSDPAALAYLEKLGSRKRVRVLRYDAPFNYSAINNWAARECDGALLGLVNNDIEVITPDWLGEMAGFALRPDTGAVGAMLYYPDDTIQHAGVLLGMLGLAGHIHCRMPRGYPGHGGRGLVAQNLSAVTGACLVVRRTVFDEVGGLDERLPVAFNDIDFCLRVRERGYRNVWTPFAELYHHESASRGLDDTLEKLERSRAEVALMQQRWGAALRDDPAYNPNLSLQTHNFELAFPPRRPLAGTAAG